MSSLTDREVHSRLVRWIEGLTSVNVIKGDQGGTLPPPPFIMTRLTGTVEVRTWPSEIAYTRVPATDPETTNTTATPVIEVEWRFSVHAFGGVSPTDTLRPIRSAQHLTQAMEGAADHPLFPLLDVFEISQIRNVPELVNEAYEQRAQMDVFLHGVTLDGRLVDIIEQYEFGIQKVVA